MKNAIIFGHTGQDGIYLSNILIKEGYNVIGVSYTSNDYLCNLADYNSVSVLINKIKPQYIFHLAAVSKTSHEYIFNNFEILVKGNLNILEAVKNYSPLTKVFVTGSGLQFKNRSLPIKETDDFEARDAYSLCRIQSVYAARYYRSIGLKIYVGFLFNHDSPFRNEAHMTQKIVKAAKRINLGSNEKILIGDLTAEKEFGIASEIALGIWTLVNQDKVFESTIGTGVAYNLQVWLHLTFSKFNLNWENHIVKVENYTSPYRILVSNPATINKLGWIHNLDIVDLNNLMMK